MRLDHGTPTDRDSCCIIDSTYTLFVMSSATCAVNYCWSGLESAGFIFPARLKSENPNAQIPKQVSKLFEPITGRGHKPRRLADQADKTKGQTIRQKSSNR